MKSSDPLEALHVPLLAMTSSAGVLVLACYFGMLWLALLAAMLVVLFMRSAWRRARWMTRTTMLGFRHESMEEARTHSLPWMLGACFGLRLFAQPSECDAEQSLGASDAPSRVVDGDGRGASSWSPLAVGAVKRQRGTWLDHDSVDLDLASPSLDGARHGTRWGWRKMQFSRLRLDEQVVSEVGGSIVVLTDLKTENLYVKGLRCAHIMQSTWRTA